MENLIEEIDRPGGVQPDNRYRIEKCGLYIDPYRTVLPDRNALLDSIGEQEAGFDSLKDQQTINRYFKRNKL